MINTREDIDNADVETRVAFLKALEGSIYHLEKDDVAKKWKVVEDTSTIERYGFTRDDFPDAQPPAPPEYVPPSLEEILSPYISAAQQRLDIFARERGYDSIMSAATYAVSTVPKFKAEGEYAVMARDMTWAKSYEILNDVQSGQRQMPTIDEFLNELPELNWPE